MKVLITGADGFIAKNLKVTLDKMPQIEILKFRKTDSVEKLNTLIQEVDFIFHLAGVNRPKESNEFYEGNTNFTQVLVDMIEKNPDSIFVICTSG
jgi:UDP-2-acetamido-2,6-beta-L-arabino-hexul-4-ose reductase